MANKPAGKFVRFFIFFFSLNLVFQTLFRFCLLSPNVNFSGNYPGNVNNPDSCSVFSPVLKIVFSESQNEITKQGCHISLLYLKISNNWRKIFHTKLLYTVHVHEVLKNVREITMYFTRSWQTWVDLFNFATNEQNTLHFPWHFSCYTSQYQCIHIRYTRKEIKFII